MFGEVDEGGGDVVGDGLQEGGFCGGGEGLDVAEAHGAGAGVEDGFLAWHFSEVRSNVVVVGSCRCRL